MPYRSTPSDGFPFYGVAKLIDRDHPAQLYVLETWRSIDGPRTRVARSGFNSLEEAQAWIEKNQPTSSGTVNKK